MNTQLISLRNIFLLVVVVFIGFGCGKTSSPKLIDKIKDKSGQEYNVTRQALARLKLPEPGVDTSNTVSVNVYPDEKIFEILIGPKEVPAGTEHLWYPTMVTSVPFDLWVQGFDWEITDSHKNIIETDILHHVNIIDPNKRDLFYPIARRLFASSNDTPGGKMPPFVGVPLKKDAPLLLNVMYQNPTDSVLTDIYLRILFPYEDKDWLNPIDVYPLYMDAGGPLLPRDFKVPAGKSVTKYASKPAVSGKILAAGSHLHNYGKAIDLVDVTSGDTLWSITPETDQNGIVKSSPSSIFFPFSKKIKKNHEYAIVAVYNNPLSKPSPDMGMGTIGGIFKPTGDEEDWAQPDYNDSLYINDMVLMLGAPKIGEWRGLTADDMRTRLGIEEK